MQRASPGGLALAELAGLGGGLVRAAFGGFPRAAFR